jgi:ribosomal protein S11
MSNFKAVQSNLNRFFKEIHLKKQYLKKVQNKARVLSELKEIHYKQVSSQFLIESKSLASTTFVMYIIDISFSKKNTLFHVSDFSGNVKFFYSAGSFQQKGKGKIARSVVLRKFYKLLVSKLKLIKKVPLAIHFKNADSNMFWFLKKLKRKFFITIVKHFNQYPYNGCRKKKIRRKKFKTGSLAI